MKWQDIDIQKAQSDFYKLEVGDNKSRIVSEPEVRYTHWAGKKSFTCIGKKNNCGLCVGGDTPKVRFLFYVIDRKDGQVKLAEFGAQIVGALKELKNNAEYVFDEIPEYDITINKKGTGMDTEYSVIPARANTSLTEDEKSAISKMKSLEKVVENLKLKTEANPVDELSGESESQIDPADIPF